MSSGWHLGAMCAFDVESTGTDVERDRIVTAAITCVDGTGKTPPGTRDWLISPAVDIPEEATAVHGITTEHARASGMDPRTAVAEIAGELLRAAGTLTPVVVFNAPFDLSILDRETRRLGLDPFGPQMDSARGIVIDPLVIDKAIDPYRKGKRTLDAIARHYGVKTGDAHTAPGDVITAARVAWAIAHRNPQIAGMSPTELHAFQTEAKAKQALSLRAYFARQGRDEQVDGSWPWRSQNEKEPA